MSPYGQFANINQHTQKWAKYDCPNYHWNHWNKPEKAHLNSDELSFIVFGGSFWKKLLISFFTVKNPKNQAQGDPYNLTHFLHYQL